MTNEPLTSQNAKFGIDYSFNDDFSINTLWSADFGTYDNLSKGFNNISSYQNEMLSNALTDNTQKSKWNTQSITIGLIKKLGKNKNELTADFDYTKADYKANQSLISDFQNTNTQNAYRSWRKGNTPSITDVFVGKIDYSHKLNENQNLSIGWKSSWINADNNAKNDTLATNNQWDNDANTTNHFVYDEQINAAYVSYQYTKNKWDFTLGLRLENTNVKGDQRTINQSFEQDYTQLFPNAALMFKPNENNSYRFSYSRRINRPDYDDLNPFRYYVDAFVFWEGNPNLKPELAHSFELNYSLKNNFYITAFYTLTDDVITSVLTQIPENNTTIRSIANINQHLNYGLDINYTFSPIKKWNSINNFIIYNNDYKGKFNNQDIATQGWTFNIKSVNTYNFRNGFTAELFANYISKRTDGVYEIDPMFRIDLGVKKSFINDKLSLKLAATDVFNTLNYKSTSDVNNVAMKQNIRLDSRVVTLSLNYRFGSGKIKEKESSTNEEQNRIRG